MERNHTWTALFSENNLQYWVTQKEFAYLDQPVTNSGNFLQTMHTVILNIVYSTEISKVSWCINREKKKDKERLDLAISPVNQQECLLKSPSRASRLTASANQDSTQRLQNRRCPAIQSFAHLSADSCGWCLMQEHDMIVSHDFRLFKIFEMFEGDWTLLKQKHTYTV